MTTRKPRIGVTMGDPAGVGPEICLDLLANESITEICTPVIFGDASVLLRCAEATGKSLPQFRLLAPNQPVNVRPETASEVPTSGAAAPRPSGTSTFLGRNDDTMLELAEPAILDITKMLPSAFTPGTINELTGAATYRYILAAIDACLHGEVDAVTTAPANKEALHAAGVHHPGHTEIFAERTGSDRFCMLQTSDEISCSFVTCHVGYHEVPELLTIERIVEVIELTRDAMRRIRGREPRLLICGLNPHAGEHGLFGQGEEERLIVPAIERAQTTGCEIQGPLPPDTAFLPQRRAESDAVVCMYHDQGHIPLKALAFDKAVNCTLGLPVIRTSVDHGTALDIAWQGKANPGSLIEAVRLAARLAG